MAIPTALLLQVPEGVASFKAVVRPEHTFIVPVIAAGKGSTDITVVVKQPVATNLYVIVAVPPDVPTVLPVTYPVAPPTVAAPELSHVPPEVASDNVIVRPEHTLFVPIIVAGNGFTVITAVVIQVVGKV